MKAMILTLLFVPLVLMAQTQQTDPSVHMKDTTNTPNPEDYLEQNRALNEQFLPYHLGDVTFVGYRVYDEHFYGKLPGVLLCHEWWGLNEYAQMRARRLAEKGYLVFACDIYGDGFATDDPNQAKNLAGQFYKDRESLRKRVKAAFDYMKNLPECDSTRVAAIGYCFGGMAALELARSGADLDAVVTLHGALNNPNPEDAKNIKCPVLVLHGADDTNVPPEEVAAFEKEMNDAGADWKIIKYAGARHGFTNPNNKDSTSTVLYNETADFRSKEAMESFLADKLKNKDENK